MIAERFECRAGIIGQFLFNESVVCKGERGSWEEHCGVVFAIFVWMKLIGRCFSHDGNNDADGWMRWIWIGVEVEALKSKRCRPRRTVGR